MGNLEVHFSSNNDTWETPPDLFRELDSEFHFTLDCCALPHNTKCPNYYTPEVDGLTKSWTGEIVWQNPPYGKQISAWVKKAYEESQKGATVVCLVPSRTDTAWWHDYAMKGEIRFLRGRLKFVGATSSAPFPSAIVIFRGGR